MTLWWSDSWVIGPGRVMSSFQFSVVVFFYLADFQARYLTWCWHGWRDASIRLRSAALTPLVLLSRWYDVRVRRFGVQGGWCQHVVCDFFKCFMKYQNTLTIRLVNLSTNGQHFLSICWFIDYRRILTINYQPITINHIRPRLWWAVGPVDFDRNRHTNKLTYIQYIQLHSVTYRNNN